MTVEIGERPWGTYEVLTESDGYKVKRITVVPGGRLSLQSHQHRAEHWVVVTGIATVTVGENTGTASAVVELREPLEEYTEAAVLKSIAVRSRELDNLRASAKTKIVISALTETAV